MRTLAAVGVAVLLAGAAAGQGRDAREQFAGAWRLVRLEHAGQAVECTGSLVFTREGHMSVQVMERNAESRAMAGQYSQGGYEASWGTYTVDESAHTFTFHVEGALVRTLVGKDLPRVYEFSGTRLVVRPARAEERWSVVWERR